MNSRKGSWIHLVLSFVCFVLLGCLHQQDTAILKPLTEQVSARSPEAQNPSSTAPKPVVERFNDRVTRVRQSRVGTSISEEQYFLVRATAQLGNAPVTRSSADNAFWRILKGIGGQNIDQAMITLKVGDLPEYPIVLLQRSGNSVSQKIVHERTITPALVLPIAGGIPVILTIKWGNNFNSQVFQNGFAIVEKVLKLTSAAAPAGVILSSISDIDRQRLDNFVTQVFSIAGQVEIPTEFDSNTQQNDAGWVFEVFNSPLEESNPQLIAKISLDFTNKNSIFVSGFDTDGKARNYSPTRIMTEKVGDTSLQSVIDKTMRSEYDNGFHRAYDVYFDTCQKLSQLVKSFSISNRDYAIGFHATLKYKDRAPIPPQDATICPDSNDYKEMIALGLPILPVDAYYGEWESVVQPDMIEAAQAFQGKASFAKFVHDIGYVRFRQDDSFFKDITVNEEQPTTVETLDRLFHTQPASQFAGYQKDGPLRAFWVRNIQFKIENTERRGLAYVGYDVFVDESNQRVAKINRIVLQRPVAR